LTIIKGVIALVIGMVLTIVDRRSLVATVGSAANIGSFAGVGSINDLLPPPSNAEASHKPVVRKNKSLITPHKPVVRKNKSLITPENAAIWMRVKPSLIWKLVKERQLLTSKRKGRTMISSRALLSQRIQRLLEDDT